MIASMPRCMHLSAVLSVLATVSSVIGGSTAFQHSSEVGLMSATTATRRTRSLYRANSVLHVIPLDGDGDNKSLPEEKNYEGDIPQLNQQHTHTPSPIREARLEREKAIRSRFVTGEELRSLRDDLKSLKENLKWSQAAGDVHRVSDLKETIKENEEKDPELVYARAISAINNAERIKDLDRRKFVIDQHRSEANLARACIPRFNLEGLWVGNYGNGAQLINITYTEAHTLVATKVTGDDYIPR